jgi:hypothetical protein
MTDKPRIVLVTDPVVIAALMASHSPNGTEQEPPA